MNYTFSIGNVGLHIDGYHGKGYDTMYNWLLLWKILILLLWIMF